MSENKLENMPAPYIIGGVVLLGLGAWIAEGHKILFVDGPKTPLDSLICLPNYLAWKIVSPMGGEKVVASILAALLVAAPLIIVGVYVFQWVLTAGKRAQIRNLVEEEALQAKIYDEEQRKLKEGSK